MEYVSYLQENRTFLTTDQEKCLADDSLIFENSGVILTH